MPLQPATHAVLMQLARDEITARDATLTDFSEGSNLDALAGAGALLADETNRYNLVLFKAHFLDTAEAGDLDALALDRFGLSRLGATYAVGRVFWTEGSASGYTVPAGTTITGTLPDGSTYTATTTADSQSDSGDSIPVIASVAGRAGNALAETLEGPTGFATDATATVSQPSRMAGGSEAENDAQFRNRLRRYYSTLAKATIKALVAAAQSVSGIYYAVVKESFGTDGGQVDVYIADADGAGNAPLVAAADTVLQATKAAGIYLVTTAAAREDMTITVEVTVPQGSDLDNAEAQIRAAVLDYCNNVPISTSVYASQIARVVHNALGSVGVSVTSKTGGSVFTSIAPAADVNTLRLLTGNLTVTLSESDTI